MAFVVLYDACVRYPAPLRDLLIRIAEAGVVRAIWSEEILEESFRNILKDRKDLSPAKLARTRELMRTALPDCLVTDYEALIPTLNLGAASLFRENRSSFASDGSSNPMCYPHQGPGEPLL